VIVSNGPPASHYNVVVLSEGYTSAQLAQFRSDATNAVNSLFSREPFLEYRPYFNAFAIAVASAESGSDHPSYPLTKKTYFNSTYDSSDRIITIPAGTNGQLKVDALLKTNMPNCDLAVLLVNDLVPGGSDGAEKTAIVSASGIADIMAHETAHVVAGLGDEYTLAFPGYPDVEEPNTTRETNRTSVKWKAWIADTTPVPTPATEEFQDVVGLFEGAHYHETGWYRPKLNCTMQSQYTPEFCEVCREALVLAFYGKVRPLASGSPQQSRLFPSNAVPVVFAVNLLQPATHSLSVEWQLNGATITNANSTNITLFPATLEAGTNTVEAIIADTTPFVRTDPGGLLRQTNTWTLRNDLSYTPPEIVLSGAGWTPDGSFAFTLSGTALQASIEGSTNLLNWVLLDTCTLVNGPIRWTNAGPAWSGARFFRGRVADVQ